MAQKNLWQQSELSLENIIKLSQTAVMSRLNCHNIGKIIEFDPLTQLCTVELMQVKQFNTQLINPAPITEVPLIILGSGGGHITMPNPTGTICLLLFLDRNIDAFLETGERYLPSTTRTHDFTDCVALTTFKTLANPLENYDERAVSIFNEEVINELKTSSYIKVYGNSIQLNVNIEGDESTGSSVTLDDKVSISNTKQSLAALIQAFVTACENITTVADESGGGLSPASKQAFAELKTKFEELLK